MPDQELASASVTATPAPTAPAPDPSADPWDSVITEARGQKPSPQPAAKASPQSTDPWDSVIAEAQEKTPNTVTRNSDPWASATAEAAHDKSADDAWQKATAISAAEPSVWRRIGDFFTGGIPRYSSRTSGNAEYGQMSLIAPKDALTPEEQKQHPVLSTLYDFTAGMTSPENTAIMAGTAGLGELPGAAGQVIPRLVSAGFSAQSLYAAAKQSRPLLNAIENGDYSTAKSLLTSMGLNVGMAALGTRHAVLGEGAVTGKTGKEAAPIAEEVAHEPASPVGRNIAGEKLPPDVRITDSTASAEHIRNQETREVYIRPTPVSRGTNVEGAAVPLNPEEHAALEKEAGRKLTTQEANLMLRARAEQGMIGALGTYDEASAIREEHRSKLEKTAEEEGRYEKKPGPTKPTLPGMENAVEEQKRAAGERQAENLTEQINRPPESIEGAAGEMETKSPLFRGTAASPQSEMFTPGGKLKPVAERFPADVVEQALAEMRGAVSLSASLPKPGRYFAETTAEEHPLAGRYNVKAGERPGGTWSGVGSQKGNIAGAFPWFSDPEINASKIQKALDKGKGADYERIVGKIADGLMREREASTNALRDYIPQLTQLSEQVKDVDPDLAARLTDLAEGKTTVAPDKLKDYINEVISDAETAKQFSEAIDTAADEARQAGASETRGDVDRPRPEDIEGRSETEDQEDEDQLRPSEVARRIPTVPTARVVADSHIPIVSRNEILAEAVAKMAANSHELAKLGIDPSQIRTPADISAMLEKTADHVQTHLDPRAQAILTFDLQRSLARDLGMSVEDLLSNKSGTAFNAEQVTAARMLLHESQNRVLSLAKQAATGDGDYLKAFMDSVAQHKAIQETVRGQAAREAGRALGAFRIEEKTLPATKITNLLAKLPESAQLQAAKLLSKIDPNNTRALNAFLREVTPSSTPDKLFEFYRNALLSGPATVIKKGASEATMLALEATKKLVASGLSKDRFAAESYWFAKGAAQALRNAKAILTGSFQLEDAPGFEETGTRAIKGTLGKIVRMPSTILSKQTNLMYAMNYFGELNAQAARMAIREGLRGEELAARQEWLAHNPNEAMTHAAHEVALHNTFQQDLGKFGASISRMVKAAPGNIGQYLFPFTKTPINLVKASAEFSPYGLFKGIAKGDVNQQAAGLVGSAIALAVAYAALNGHITGGGPVDWKKQQTLESTGWQPYSIKVGNKYYSFHRWEPIGLTFGLIADAIHGAKTGDDPEVTQSKADTAVAHIMRNAQSLPFLYEMSALLQAIDDPSGRRVDNFVDRQIASFIPTGVADVAAGTDRTVRHPSNLAETIESRVPGLTSRVPASIDVTGKPLQRPANALGGANPFPVTTAKNDPVVSEMARLGIANEQAPKTVKRPGTSKRVVPWALTPAESAALQADDAQKLYTWLQKRVNEPGWADKKDDNKRDLIREEKERIAQTRWSRVNQMRRAAKKQVASGE